MEQQLSVRSSHARRIARQIAKRERRTVRQVVERALEHYASSPPTNTDKSNPAEFWLHLNRDHSTDIDLQALVDLNRVPHSGVKL